VALDKEATIVSGPVPGRTVDEGVCGILVCIKGEPGNITISESVMSSSSLVIKTGPDKTGHELILIKRDQRATILRGASGRLIRRHTERR
jgi:hypothetical protein